MKILSLSSVFIAGLLFQSCASVKSDISYHKGTEKLWEGDIENAIAYLQDAIELNPTVARNHYHLAIAYQRLNDINQAWKHIRNAYLLDTKSNAQLQVFTRIYNQLSDQHQLTKKRLDAAEVVNILGVGDKYLHDDNGVLQAIYYGPVCLRFEHNHLTGSEWYLNDSAR